MNAIYNQLESKVLPLMSAYQTDVTTHDRREIEENAGTPFVHVTREMSSHMFMKPDKEWLDTNAPQPYLFGRSTPREIEAGNLDLLKTYFNDSDTFHISDGHCVVQVSRAHAISTFEQFRSN